MSTRISIREVLVFICLITLFGCGTPAHRNSIFRTVSADTPESVFIDAKQRAILFQKVTEADGTEIIRACAEPSPDVFSVLSSSLSASGTFKKQSGKEIAAQLASSISETGSNIGLRTQSIQILRDMMYRLCERYFSGAIGKEEFKIQAARDHRLVIAILAIEQLSGAVVPRPIALTSAAQADTGTKLLEIQENLDKEKQRLDGLKIESANVEAAATQAQEEANQAKKELDTATMELANVKGKTPAATKAELDAVREKVDNAQEKYDKLKGEVESKEAARKKAQGDVKEAEKNLASLETKREAARSAQATSSGGAVIGSAGQSCCVSNKGDCCRRLTDAQTTTVAKAVVDLIDKAFDFDEVLLQCMAIISRRDENDTDPNRRVKVEGDKGTRKTTDTASDAKAFCQKYIQIKETEQKTRQVKAKMELEKQNLKLQGLKTELEEKGLELEQKRFDLEDKKRKLKN